MLELDGATYLYYATGDQATWGALRVARYPGPLREFYEVDRVVIFHHGLRNAMLPIVTIVGLQLGALLGGAVLTETVFGLPGVGTFLVASILARIILSCRLSLSSSHSFLLRSIS